MRAAMYYGIEDLRVVEVPTPECGDQDLLIRVGACGICGSDGRIYYRGHREVSPPQILGHEIAGTIVQVGRAVTGYREGDRVNLTPEVTCGHCRFCRQGRPNMCAERRALGLYYAGGFAEYMLVPAAAVRQGNVVRVPEGVSLAEAALTEPISCCLNANESLRMGPGDRVVVLGAGAMGCLMLQLAQLCGAAQTILINGSSHRRLALAARVGADHALSASDGDPVTAVRDLTGGDGADVVIVAANAVSAAEQAVQMAARRGRVCFFASLPTDTPRVTLDGNSIHYREIAIFGAFSSHRDHADTALALIASGRLDVERLITHRLPLDDLERGIAMKRAGETIKAVVLPWDADRAGC